MASVQPHSEFCIVRPRPDIHSRLTTLHMTGGVVDDAIFGKVRTDDLVTYKNGGVRNCFAFGEVLRMGKGLARGPSSELPQVTTGAIVGFDLAQVAAGLPSDEGKKDAEGKTLLEEIFLVPFKALLCRFDEGAKLPVPLGNFVMTVEDPAGMDQFQFGAERGASKLILPDTVRKDGIRSNDKPNTRVRVAVERVVGVGPGKWIKGVFAEPDAVLGRLVVFMNPLSVDLNAYSKRHRFTPFTNILASLDA